MQKFFSTEFCFSKRIRPWPILISEMWVHTTKRKHFCICQRQILTLEAAQDEIINKNFTSPELVLPLPSFDQSLQRLPQQAFWRWTIQNLPCLCCCWLVVFNYVRLHESCPFLLWALTPPRPQSTPIGMEPWLYSCPGPLRCRRVNLLGTQLFIPKGPLW